MLRLAICLVLFAHATGAWAERRVALLLGIERYTALRPLANPVNDAVAIKDSLQSLGFEVYLETNRDLRRTRRALEDFAYDAGEADLAIVFYAGHGLEVGGKNLLLPTDADPATLDTLRNTALPLTEVTETLTRVAPKAVLLIDACRSEPFGTAEGRAAVALARDAPIRPGLGRLGRADGLVYAFAAAPGQAALDGAGDNSPFTEALLRHLAIEGLELRSVLTLVQQDVYDRTRGQQLPYVESGLPDLVFAAGAASLPERERLLLAMAEIVPDDRAAVERIAAQNDMPLAPLFGALIQAKLAEATLEGRDRQLAEAAAAYTRVRAEIKSLSAADPAVTALRAEADDALSLGAFDTARAALSKAAGIDRTSRETLRENLLARTLSEAETLALSAGAAAADLRRDLAVADYARAVALYDEALALQPGTVVRQGHLEALDALGKLQLTLGNVPDARSSLEDLFALALMRAESDPDQPAWQQDLSIAYSRLGDVSVLEGKTAQARAAFEAALAIRERVGAENPSNDDWQRDLSIAQNRIGDLAVAEGDLVAAVAAYAAALAIRERQATDRPGALEPLKDLSASHIKMGQVALLRGDLAAAESSYAAALSIRQRMAELAPETGNVQRDLAFALQGLGDVVTAKGDFAAAQEAYASALKIKAQFAASDPGNSEWQQDLSLIHGRLGDLQMAVGDLEAARAAFDAALAIDARLAATDPANTQWQRNLSVSQEKLGDLAMLRGDLPAARRHYQSSLAVAFELAASDRANSGWQRDLSVSHSRLGNLAIAQGRLGDARRSHRAALELRKRLATLDPTNGIWQHDLSVSHRELGALAMRMGDYGAAQRSLSAARQVMGRLLATEPENREWRADLAFVERSLGDVSRAQGDVEAARDAYEAALTLWAGLAESEPDNTSWAWQSVIDLYNRATVANDPLPHLEAALAAAERLAAQSPLSTERWERVDWLRQQVSQLRSAR